MKRVHANAGLTGHLSGDCLTYDSNAGKLMENQFHPVVLLEDDPEVVTASHRFME